MHQNIHKNVDHMPALWTQTGKNTRPNSTVDILSKWSTDFYANIDQALVAPWQKNPNK